MLGLYSRSGKFASVFPATFRFGTEHNGYYWLLERCDHPQPSRELLRSAMRT